MKTAHLIIIIVSSIVVWGLSQASAIYRAANLDESEAINAALSFPLVLGGMVGAYVTLYKAIKDKNN